MITRPEQQQLDFGVRPGCVYTCWDRIVIVTAVGMHDDYGHWNARCCRYIPIGAVEYRGHGAYWKEDMEHPRGGIFTDHYLEDQAGHCADIYFKPWNGRGVFFATRQATVVERINKAMMNERRKKKPNYARLDQLDMRRRAMFLRQVAPVGFE